MCWLVNNAGISSIEDVSGLEALKVFDTNAIGLIRVTQASLRLLGKSENPVVVNVSSALGSFWAVTNPDRRQVHFPSIVYGSRKAAVFMLTVQYAKAIPGIKFNAGSPASPPPSSRCLVALVNRSIRAPRSLCAWRPSAPMGQLAPSGKRPANWLVTRFSQR
jgi:NAD(P)-dependent dehydrogenase (short-subunit alcohol dehydrogenase family)